MNAIAEHHPPPARRLRLLQVVGNTIVGGMETYVERLIERLPPERYAITALLPQECPFGERLRGHGVEVFITPMPEDPPWVSIQFAHMLIRHAGIQVVHTHLANGHLLGGLAGQLAGTPVLASVHGRQLAILDLEAHRATGTHVHTVCAQTYYHALGLGIAPAQLSCVPNGVDTERFHPRAAGREAEVPVPSVRTRLGLAPAVPLVGFIGRLSPEKGPEVFLRTALQLRDRCPAAHFVLLGEGPMRDMATEFIARHHLHDRVHLAGLLDRMPVHLRSLDVVVSTSHSEAMPLALMEAMASGVPVVATRVGGVPDMVVSGHTGWLATPGDPNGIAHCVARLIEQPDERLAFGAAARERAVRHMSLATSVQQIEQLYARLVQGHQQDVVHNVMPGIGPAPAGRRSRAAGR